jgi:hypothetical protein
VCPQNKQTKFWFEPKKTETRSVLVCFVKSKAKKFQFVSVFRTYIQTTETNRTVSKQTETNRNNPKFSEKFLPKYALYQTVSVGLLFVSVQSTHRNSLFRYRTETNCFETNCFETNRNKPEKSKQP